MANGSTKVLGVLDREIAKTTARLEQAKRAAEQIIQLTNDLVSLKRARQLLAGDSSQSMQELIAEVNAPPQRQVAASQNGHIPKTITSTVEEPSIGATIMEVLTKTAKPMKLAQILAAVQSAGKPNLTARTLSAIISQYKTKGKIRQAGPGIYIVAEVDVQEKRMA